jgi:hypothetical protein
LLTKLATPKNIAIVKQDNPATVNAVSLGAPLELKINTRIIKIAMIIKFPIILLVTEFPHCMNVVIGFVVRLVG